MEMTREQNFYMAKISEQAERFDETRMYMAKVIGSLQAGEELTAEERSLLSIAYKNVIGVRLASWRIVCSVEHREANSGSLDKFESIRAFRDKIEAELSDICNEILRLVDERLLPFAESAESKVFYLKIEGDYNRYIAEFKIGAERSDFADKTLEAYKLAQDIALTELAPSNPIRLGLALNFSVFYYEILNSPEKACSLAKQAFDEAAGEIETLEEEPHNDTTLMMQLLRDNLTLWNSDMKDDLPDIEEIRGKAKPDDKQQLNPGKN